MPHHPSARLDALARHLPFRVDDFDAAREAFLTWRRTGAEADRQTAQLWAYCYIVWYFYGKLARERGGPTDLDRIIERASKRVFRSMEAVRDPECFPQYVSVVCRNLLSSYRARRQTTVELEDAYLPVPATEAVELDRPLIRKWILHAIDSLPPAIAEVVRMRLLDELDYADIAQATGLSLPTARAYYSKAIARLRDDPALRMLAEDDPDAFTTFAPRKG